MTLSLSLSVSLSQSLSLSGRIEYYTCLYISCIEHGSQIRNPIQCLDRVVHRFELELLSARLGWQQLKQLDVRAIHCFCPAAPRRMLSAQTYNESCACSFRSSLIRLRFPRQFRMKYNAEVLYVRRVDDSRSLRGSPHTWSFGMKGVIYFVHNGCFEGFAHHLTVILVMRRRQMREFRHGGS